MNSTSEKLYNLPNGDKKSVDELVKLFKNIQSTPIPVSASIGLVDQQPKSCQIGWSFDNYERVDSVKFVTNCLFDYNESNQLTQIQELPGLTEVSNELASVISKSGRHRICISKSKESSKNGSSSNQRFDIWDLNQNTILNSIDVDSTKHGAICLSGRLRSLEFSPNESQFMYVAERKIKSESYFKEDSPFKDAKKDEAKKDETKKDDEKPSKGNEYEYIQNWGEQTGGLKSTVVCIVTLKPELKLKIIDLPDKTLSQPFWIDNTTIGFIAFKENPRSFGLHYCFNRINYLYKCKLAQNDEEKDFFEVIRGEKDDLHMVDPKINHKREKVLWFENEAFGPHIQAKRAMLWDLKTNEISIIFDQYEQNQPIIKSLFSMDIVYDCWTLDGEHVILTTLNHSREILFVLNVVNKSIKIIETGLLESTDILNFKNDLLVVKTSSPNQPPIVKIGQFDLKTESLIEFKQLRVKYPTLDSKISYRLIKQNEDKLLEQIETIVIGSTDTFDKPSSVLIIPHGGPHSASLLAFNKTSIFYAKLGFKVVFINYRGSLGITKEYVEQLCSKVGEMDVADVMSSINNLIKMNLVDKNNIHLLGGSHGGFLVCHLIGQYPDLFASCVALNPVTDMSKMFNLTDIPDWTVVETFGVKIETYKKINNWPEENNLSKQMIRIIDVGNPDIIKPMFEKSPIYYVDKVKTPVLMMLGQVDLRVPHSQGLSFMRALKARNVETKCHLYDDNHNIGKPVNYGDETINTCKWILEHLRN